jgi:mono/diheme cytochrome c family protein
MLGFESLLRARFLLAWLRSVQVFQAQSTGESLFKTKCAACHGQDGKGEVPMEKNSVPAT